MEQLFGAIPQVLGELAPNASVSSAVVFAAWNRCAGQMLKARTSPMNFTANRLVVAVQDKTWRLHLEDLSSTMLVKLNGVLGQGTVKFVEFRVDKKAVDAVRAASLERNNAHEVSVEAPPSLIKAANAIADENLREHFLSSAAVYLKRQKER